MGIKSGVPLGCNVPVERQMKIEPPVVAKTNGRKEKTCLALIANGKADKRKVQDGYSMKVDQHMLRSGMTTGMIQYHFTGGIKNVVVTFSATTVVNTLETLTLSPFKEKALRATMRPEPNIRCSDFVVFNARKGGSFGPTA